MPPLDLRASGGRCSTTSTRSSIGLTATPNKQAFGFFNQNLVMEYTHEQAVADGVNVDFDVYRIRTEITRAGRHDRSRARDRLPRPPDARAALGAARRRRHLRRRGARPGGRRQRTRSARSSETFSERLFTEIFPGRTEVPKTLIFAKDDSHADDIVQIVREEFGKGDEFAVEDHLQVDRPQAGRADRVVPQLV